MLAFKGWRYFLHKGFFLSDDFNLGQVDIKLPSTRVNGHPETAKWAPPIRVVTGGVTSLSVRDKACIPLVSLLLLSTQASHYPNPLGNWPRWESWEDRAQVTMQYRRVRNRFEESDPTTCTPCTIKINKYLNVSTMSHSLPAKQLQMNFYLGYE